MGSNMSNTPINITIVPSMPDFFIVYDDEQGKEIIIGEHVVAWRVETYQAMEYGDMPTIVKPINFEGSTCSNYIGVQNPDKTIDVYHERTYKNLGELQEYKYPKE